MNHITPDKKTDVICHCSGTTKGQIKELIHSGIDNLDGISRMTGACSGCGACDVSVLELLAENIAACGV
jgi:NAD(P)H-nitrite reductase large subunit